MEIGITIIAQWNGLHGIIVFKKSQRKGNGLAGEGRLLDGVGELEGGKHLGAGVLGGGGLGGGRGRGLGLHPATSSQSMASPVA